MSDIAIIGIGCRFAGGIDTPESFWQFLIGKHHGGADRPADPWEIDPDFFGFAPPAAGGLDPRERLLLDVTRDALDDAGVAGVPVEVYAAGAANGLAPRISHVLGGSGGTDCSSSLDALQLACRALDRGECAVAVAGGVHLLEAALDGDEGGGMVVLKKLGDAVRAGDRVYAVVEAGRGATGETSWFAGSAAPGTASETAWRSGSAGPGVADDTAGRAGSAGPGTADEMARPAGSVAPGVAGETRGRAGSAVRGAARVRAWEHTLDGAEPALAGIAGVIESALAIQRRVLPNRGRLHAAASRIPIDSPGPDNRMTIAVNDFGDARVTLREHRWSPGGTARHYGVLPLSGRSAAAVRATATRYADLISAGADPGRLAETVWTKTTHHAFRTGMLLGDTGELVRRLRHFAAGAGADPARAVARHGEGLVFVCSGAGAQWWGMGRELLSADGVFAATAHAVDAQFQSVAGWSILDELLMRGETDCHAGAVDLAGPANFLVQVALVAELAEFGIRPAGVLGHGTGEIAAAYLTGALSLRDAVRVAHHRALTPLSLGDLRTALTDLAPQRPTIPLYSTITGAPVTGADWDAEYWCATLPGPARFAAAVSTAAAAGNRVFLEIGAHPVLSDEVRRILRDTGVIGAAAHTLDRTRSDSESVRRTLTDLYAAGALDLTALFPPDRPTTHRPPRDLWHHTRSTAPLPQPVGVQ
ncbi:acyltransferase domain-containing protein [Nocardia sp. NPDC050435]|uniref:acyltransferase domain-containing protein n=1 Tax=Nocardia sp. NPDC050435 TaxID=3155040 RepID=UPI0033FC8C66